MQQGENTANEGKYQNKQMDRTKPVPDGKLNIPIPFINDYFIIAHGEVPGTDNKPAQFTNEDEVECFFYSPLMQPLDSNLAK